MENFWQACSSQLEQELTPQQFSAWIKPLAPIDFEDGKLRIGAPNRFKLDWVQDQFAKPHYELAVQFWTRPWTCSLCWTRAPIKNRRRRLPQLHAIRQPRAREHAGRGTIVTHRRAAGIVARSRKCRRAASKPHQFRADLRQPGNGKANQLARAAAIQVANTRRFVQSSVLIWRA